MLVSVPKIASPVLQPASFENTGVRSTNGGYWGCLPSLILTIFQRWPDWM